VVNSSPRFVDSTVANRPTSMTLDVYMNRGQIHTAAAPDLDRAGRYQRPHDVHQGGDFEA
jgi:hypothetical protein